MPFFFCFGAPLDHGFGSRVVHNTPNAHQKSTSLTQGLIVALTLTMPLQSPLRVHQDSIVKRLKQADIELEQGFTKLSPKQRIHNKPKVT